MFAKEITLYSNELVNKIETLTSSGYFKTVRELYLTGGLVGVLFDKYENNYSRKGDTKKIFSEQLNKEFETVRYAATISSLIKTDSEDKLLMKKAFGDWYEQISIDNSDKCEIEKYEHFYKFAIAGINYIYDSLYKDNVGDEDAVHSNFIDLITEIEGLQEKSDKYSIIEDAFKN